MVDDDAHLVERLRAGDEEAFAILVRRYQPRLVRLARSLVRNPAVAEEAVQDTWLGVVRGIDKFAEQATFRTWLFRILVNRARSAAAREKPADPLPGDSDPGLPADRFDRSGGWIRPPETWTERVDDRLTAVELAGRARACLEHLPAGQRQVVLLRDVEGLPAREVCAMLGIEDGHQRVLLHRGRTKVRRMLEDEMRVG